MDIITKTRENISLRCLMSSPREGRVEWKAREQCGSEAGAASVQDMQKATFF